MIFLKYIRPRPQVIAIETLDTVADRLLYIHTSTETLYQIQQDSWKRQSHHYLEIVKYLTPFLLAAMLLFVNLVVAFSFEFGHGVEMVDKYHFHYVIPFVFVLDSLSELLLLVLCDRFAFLSLV